MARSAALLLFRKMIMTQTSVEAQPNIYVKAGFHEPVAKLHNLDGDIREGFLEEVT